MNILITGAWQQADQYIDTLNSMGHHIAFMQWEKDPLPCDSSWVEAIIGNGIFQSHPIEQFVNLQYIQLTSAGFDRVPMNYVQEHGIIIHNARGVYSIPMAEYAVSGVLYLYKQMAFFHENQKKHLWEKHRSLMELTEKKVLILGCGSVGRECAKRFAAFGCEIVGVNRSLIIDSVFNRIVSIDALNHELGDTDIIILTIPLTAETYHMIGKDQFRVMKKSAILVNISRGAVVDQDSLEDALEQKQIRGAILDVFEEEPLPEKSRLWEMEQVIVTPHNSFVGELNQKRLGEVIIDNLRGEIWN